MEKDMSGYNRSLKRILVTGPESTGKTELVSRLTNRFNGTAVEEYARGFVEGLDRPYTFEDVEHIARHQILSYEKEISDKEWVFFDTWLIITRVWFDVVFKTVPAWIDDALKGARFDLVLLCAPDIPWIPDGVRENGGIERERLFERYKKEIVYFGMEWDLVTGTGEERFARAEEIIFKKLGYGTI
ncbi:MAG: ATP-binding protein [Bacteroidales bacterium]